MATRRMATRVRSGKRSKSTQPKGGAMAKRTAGQSASKKKDLDLKSVLFTTAIWGLGLINVILIFSFISKHFLSGNEHTISAETPVAVAPGEVIKIEVLNACGVHRLAKEFADMLKTKGFDAVNIDNFGDGSTLPRTYIIDRKSNAMTYGLQMAKALGLPEEYVSYQASPDRMVTISLILGNDYKEIPASPVKE